MKAQLGRDSTNGEHLVQHGKSAGKKKKRTTTEGVSNLHCTCAGNSLLVIKEMGSCCACPPDMPREHSRLRNQAMTAIIRNTQPRKSCYCIQRS